MPPVLAKTLDDLHDALWDMRPRSRHIYEDKRGRIGQRCNGQIMWYSWSDKDGGYVWTGSTNHVGRWVTRWRRIT